MSSETTHPGTYPAPYQSRNRSVSPRANALAERLEQGAASLIALASDLTDAQWQSRIPGDGRKVGVVVHHVATMYPLEIELAKILADGKPVVGVTMNDVHAMNAKHAEMHGAVTRAVALELLAGNSGEAAAFIRTLSDQELDRAAPASLYAEAPITCQFMLEDHAVRHSYHHLARIQAVVG